MTIVERLRVIAGKIGANPNGTSMQAILSDIEAKLDEKSVAPDLVQTTQQRPNRQKKAEKTFFSTEKKADNTEE